MTLTDAVFMGIACMSVVAALFIWLMANGEEP